VSLYVAVSLGTVPSSDVLKGLLPFETGGSTGEEVGESLQAESGASMKAQKVSGRRTGIGA